MLIIDLTLKLIPGLGMLQLTAVKVSSHAHRSLRARQAPNTSSMDLTTRRIDL